MSSDDREKLMTEIITLFSEQFGNHAVLKGGMELRLLDCPRFTNDLDYQFVPYSSKNDVRDSILSVLHALSAAEVSLTAHSACIRYLIRQDGDPVQVEVNVASECATQVMSTASLARRHNLPPCLVRGMRLDHALAHKLAAWNERGLIRDLYDASFICTVLDTVPDLDTLQMRLSDIRPRHGRIRAAETMSLDAFCNKLENAAARLDAPAVAAELRDYFAPPELVGLEMNIKVGIRRIINLLTNADS